nr:MAG TPA: hypothetical protein [Caudoviricetes sp.]
MCGLACWRWPRIPAGRARRSWPCGLRALSGGWKGCRGAEDDSRSHRTMTSPGSESLHCTSIT